VEFFHLVDELLYLSNFETQKASIRVMPAAATEAYDLTILEALEVDICEEVVDVDVDAV
jgi:hypothetical protein